jgi:UDP-N-acetyl-D-galactosamine dehydrogenase
VAPLTAIDGAVAEHEYGIRPVARPKAGSYDAIVLAVAHREFREMGIGEIRRLARRRHVIFDIKHVFPADQVDGRL